MSEPPRKKVRCNNVQKEKLVAYMREHRDVALGTFTCPMGLQAQNAKWGELADALVELGPARSVDQWKTTWRDLKSRAKTNHARAHQASTSTGNRVEVPALSTQDDGIISIIGRITSQGIASVPESSIGSVAAEVVLERTPSPEPLPRHSPMPPPLPNLSTPLQTALPQSVSPVARRRHGNANLGEIYARSSEGITSVLSDISNHLRRRNEIEMERNEILREKNQILLAAADRADG